MPDNGDFFAEFLDDFFAECDEHLTHARQALLALEAAPNDHADRSLFDELFRSFHSLKGLAGMVGLASAEQLAHQLESYLRAARQTQARLTPAALEELRAGARVLEQVIAARRTDSVAPDITPAIERLSAREQDGMTIAAASGQMAQALPPDVQSQLTQAQARGEPIWNVIFTPTHTLSEQGTNVNVVRARLQDIGTLIYAAPRVTDTDSIAFDFLLAGGDAATLASLSNIGVTFTPNAPAHLASVDTTFNRELDNAGEPIVAPSQIVRVDLGRLDDLLSLVGTLVITRSRLETQLAALEPLLPVAMWRDIHETTAQLARQLRDVRAGVVRLRMTPIGELFARMRFVTYDVARALGKQVALDVRGQETEIDKFVVERMLDPLLHLVRNALSHGIESPGERVASGKPAIGTLSLRAATAGDTIVIEIEDDGRGINGEQVAAQARAYGLLADNAPLDSSHLLDLICTPGFSTRNEADRVSGRGVGMDSVRKAVSALGGMLALQTTIGRGTCFTIHLPLTLAIVDALIVNTGGQTFAVPLPLVREVVRIDAEQVSRVAQHELIWHRGNALPLIALDRRFGLPTTPAPGRYAFVVGNGRRW
jgi:two-component system chemotaxis sensor kinase CheA